MSGITQVALKHRIDSTRPRHHVFVKHAPILGYLIATDRFEDLPIAIRTRLGSVDQTTYSPDYLKDKVGSMVVLQMNDSKPDFHPIGLKAFQNYQRVSVSEVQTKNPALMEEVRDIEGMAELLDSRDPRLIGARKTIPVEMIRLSEIGYPVDQEITLQSAWGPQTKPSTKEAYVVWDENQNSYYMVNTDSAGLPIGYRAADAKGTKRG